YDPAPLRGVFDSTTKPVLAFGRIAQNVSEISRKYQAETGVPFIHGLPETIRALRNLVRYAEGLQRPVPPPDPPVAARAPDNAAPEALLAEQGLGPPRWALAASPEAAAVKAAAIGFPVAVKIVSPQASHKTEVGGVALHLADADAVRAAAERMAARPRAPDPRAAVAGVPVPGVGDGVGVLVWGREDPQIGAMI